MKTLLFCVNMLIAATPLCAAKDNYEMSTAVGLEEVGINKVLCMKNGYTLLFHFENNKPINLIIFDTLHKRVANTHHHCNELDVMMLTTTMFKGLYEVNGEAVLFFQQQNSGRHSLIRLRFDPIKGKLIEEATIGSARGIAKPMSFFVMKHKGEDGYEVLYSEEVQQFKECKINLTYYNARHEVVKEIPLNFDRKKYDYMHVIGAESLPEGVCVSLGLSNMVVNGTGNTMATAAVYNHYLHVFYIPKDSTKPKQRTAELSSNLVPYYTNFSYNPFAGNINLMLLSYTDALYQNGVDMQPTAFLSNLLFRFDEQTFSANYGWLTNKLANNMQGQKKDTSVVFRGVPVKMVTNGNGLSTVVSESYERYASTENFAGSQGSATQSYIQAQALDKEGSSSARSEVLETIFGNICITQFDDDGKELWGTILPKAQYYSSLRHYYNPADLAKKWQQQAMFNDLPPQVYDRQFMSTNIYNSGGNFFIVFNGGDKRPGNIIGAAADTVFESALSNACYYKINKKKEIEKKYLLGEPLVKEYKSSFIEGADFDEQRGVYASLIRYKRGEYVSLRMAWVKME